MVVQPRAFFVQPLGLLQSTIEHVRLLVGGLHHPQAGLQQFRSRRPVLFQDQLAALATRLKHVPRTIASGRGRGNTAIPGVAPEFASCGDGEGAWARLRFFYLG